MPNSFITLIPPTAIFNIIVTCAEVDFDIGDIVVNGVVAVGSLLVVLDVSEIFQSVGEAAQTNNQLAATVSYRGRAEFYPRRVSACGKV